MRKIVFNAKLWGYYVVSIVLGIAMALTVSMMACDLWNFAFERYVVVEDELESQYGSRYGTEHTNQGRLAWEEADAELDKLDRLWTYVPLNWLGNELYSVPGTAYKSEYSDNYVPLAMAVSAMVTVLLSVLLMEGKSANKAWRQKMLQAVAIAALILLSSIAWQCAEWRTCGKWSSYPSMRKYGVITTWHVLTPIVLMIIPLIGLKKTRLRKENEDAKRLNREVIGDFGGMLPGTGIAVEVDNAEKQE